MPRAKTIASLKQDYGFEIGVDYKDILMGYNYSKEDGLNTSHFKKMRERKLENLKLMGDI